MYTPEEDFCGSAKCKSNLSLFDKFVLSCTFIIMGCCVVLMIIGILYPERLICN